LNNYNRQGYDLNLESTDLPAVLIRIGDNPITLIEAGEIVKCFKLKDLEDLFYTKLRLRIDDIDQWTEKQKEEHKYQDLPGNGASIASARPRKTT
jgi:hypothetical protein